MANRPAAIRGKVLITGGAGFLGLHLGRRLAGRGWRVDLLDDFSRGVRDADLAALLRSPGIRMLELDLRRAGAVESLDRDYNLIFHLAAVVGVARVIRQPWEVLVANTELTVRALEAARRQKRLGRFVFASTSEVYAAASERGELPLPTPEGASLVLPDPAAPRSVYALSKLFGEALCHHSSVPFTITRPHNVYGPRMGMAHVIPELLHRADRAPDRGAITVASIDHTRTFCYVDDAVAMIEALALAAAAEDGTFNVGIEAPEISIGTLAEAITVAVGRSLTVTPAPPTPGSPPRRCPDLTATRRVIGHREAVSLADGLAQTLSWYRRTGFGGAR